MAGRRQHGEGSVYHRASRGQWVAVADLGWRNGKRDRREFTGPTPDAALAKRERFLDRRRDGFTMPRGRQPYVSEWLLHWLHNVAKRKVEATTWEKSYRQKVTELICPYFDRIPLGDLAEEDIEDWHRELEGRVSKRTGRPLSASTIGQAHRIMSTALKLAVVRGKLPRNPCSNVTPPRDDETPPDPPDSAETLAILDRCRTWPNGARWVLAVTTGLRQGEALALEWKDVDLPGRSVTVRRATARVAGERITKAPKTAAGVRSVPLGSRAVTALQAHRDAQVVRDLRNDLVFRSARGRPVHPKVDYDNWLALLADLGLPHYRVHDCRHGYATVLLEQGTDPRVVQQLLGWSSGAMLKRYQHVRKVMHDKARDAIDDAFGE